MARKKPVVGPDLTPDWLEKWMEKRRSIMGEIDAQLTRGLREPGKGLTLNDLQGVVEHRSKFSSPQVEMLAPYNSFYHQFFGLDLDFSSVPIPRLQPGFDRTLIVAQGFMPNRVYEACQQYFKCWRYTDDLDAALDWDREERNPQDAPYAIRVRDRQEADKELQNLSANQIKEMGLTTETLTERLLHELMYWSVTQKHLDTDNVTLCSGSRDRDGHVPGVDWSNGEMRVRCDNPGFSRYDLRVRVVVS